MSFTPSQNLKPVAQIGPYVDASFGANNPDADLTYPYVSMANYHSAMAIFQCMLATADTAVCIVLEADNATGTNAAPITGKTVTLTGDGSTPQVGVIDIHPVELTDPQNHPFIGLRITTNTNDDLVCGLILLCEPRYAGDSAKGNLPPVATVPTHPTY